MNREALDAIQKGDTVRFESPGCTFTRQGVVRGFPSHDTIELFPCEGGVLSRQGQDIDDYRSET